MESQKPVWSMPDPGQCGSDRDVFLRVWNRVMPRESPDCPIEVERQQCVWEPAVPAMQGMPAPAPQPRAVSPMTAAPMVRAVDRAGDDFPTWEDVPCLGSEANSDREKLQDMIGRELLSWRRYQILARRGGQGSRTLAAMAGNCRRRAKRLSAALFLISGVRYWPGEQVTASEPRSYFDALREHFLAEQNRGQTYRAAAEESRDLCLHGLYLDLADECAEHTCRIRTLLENA